MAIFIDKNKKDSGYFLLKDNEENDELFKIYLTEEEMIQLKKWNTAYWITKWKIAYKIKITFYEVVFILRKMSWHFWITTVRFN